MLGGLINSILGGILGGNLGRQQSQRQFKGVYRGTLDHTLWWDSDLETAANYITCTGGVWTVIGRYQVKPQELIALGFGNPGFPDNQGYAYIALYDDTATNSVQEHGMIRLAQRDYNSYIPIVVAEDRSRIWAAHLTDRAQMKPLPEQIDKPLVGEDSYLEIHFKADADDSVVATAIGTAALADVWDVPITRRIL